MALSHCWGGVVSYTTTAATLKQRSEQIPLAVLPVSFRDAVLVT